MVIAQKDVQERRLMQYVDNKQDNHNVPWKQVKKETLELLKRRLEILS